jgi:phosphate starvation-inducible PhoH-like protein
MKMVLTRLGEGSKMVVDGDPDQSDLEPGQSGLQPVVERLLGLRNIAVTVFNEDDIVRHETVKAVVSRLGKDFGKAAAKPAKPAPATKRAPAAKAPKRQG